MVTKVDYMVDLFYFNISSCKTLSLLCTDSIRNNKTIICKDKEY